MTSRQLDTQCVPFFVCRSCIELKHLFQVLIRETIAKLCGQFFEEFLKARGIHIIVIPGLSICTKIIDKSCVWYGGINTLGYATEEDNVIRLIDVNLAGELIDTLMTPPKDTAKS